MATPNYQGQGQPPASSGGWLSSWFGDPTPAYLAAPNTSTSTSTRTRSFFGFAAPAYKLAPQPETDCDASAPAEIAIVIPRQAIDPQT